MIERGARIALVGPNGAGKSTMMKMLAGIEPMTAASASSAATSQAGYFAQNLADTLDYTKTVYDELSERATDAMSELARFAVCSARCCSRATTWRKKSRCCRAASARGWRCRRCSRIATTRLLLDEPTNNLDIVAKDTLLEALKALSRHRLAGQPRSLHPQ